MSVGIGDEAERYDGPITKPDVSVIPAASYVSDVSGPLVCHGCGAEDSNDEPSHVAVLVGIKNPVGGGLGNAFALCQRCRLKLEARLRGARKAGY